MDCLDLLAVQGTFKSPLVCKEIQPVNPKGNQYWICIGRIDAEVPILWPPDVKSQLIGKGLDAGKDRRHEENQTTEDEVDGWDHWLNGQEFQQTSRDGDVQGSLKCCSLWGWTWLSDWTTILPLLGAKLDFIPQPFLQLVTLRLCPTPVTCGQAEPLKVPKEKDLPFRICWKNEEDPAAAAAKSLQSCPILCYPIDGSPRGFPVPRILQARTLEWVAISFSNAWK